MLALVEALAFRRLDNNFLLLYIKRISVYVSIFSSFVSAACNALKRMRLTRSKKQYNDACNNYFSYYYNEFKHGYLVLIKIPFSSSFIVLVLDFRLIISFPFIFNSIPFIVSSLESSLFSSISFHSFSSCGQF